MPNTSTTKTNPHPVVTMDADDHGLDVAILRALSESDDADDRALGVAGVAAFDAARERGEGILSSLGLARLAMTNLRSHGYA